ncbi:MAG: aspartate aminotransferase family protein [Planctomycetota bacterium]|nr:aspartate aminotransferase family protein [Planctomycetota bacterium]
MDVSEGDVNRTPGRRSYQSRVLDEATKARLDADAAAYLHQSLSTPCITLLERAKGSTLTDAQGHQLLDFHGNSAHQVGHGHPRVIDAVKRQLDTLAFCPRRFTNEPAIELAQRLGALTGGRLTKALLAPGGTLAMGMALKLARLATGRFKFVSMWGSFHGASLDCISIGGEAVFRQGIGPLLPGCEHVIPCAPAECVLGCEGTCSLACARAVEDVLEREGDVAAVVLEPVRCTTVEIPPAEYLRRIRTACDRAGALLIFDEIPTCLGRTGRMFSYEHFGVVPDMLAIGKGLGGGVMPQAALLARADLDVGAHTALGHYTHEKSPLGSAAALATLDVIRDEGLVERSAALGERWTSHLRAELGGLATFREVRGLGLLVGVELRARDEASIARCGSVAAATGALCDRVLYACMERGLSFKVSGGRVLTLTPPLTVGEDELDRATAILREAVRTA